MKVGILINTTYAKKLLTKYKVFAPGALATALIKGLRKRGHAVTVFAPLGSDLLGPIRGEQFPVLETELKKEKMDILQYISKNTLKFGRIAKEISGEISYRAFTEAKKEKLDILHVFCSNTSYPNYFTELTNVPTVTTVHNTPQGGSQEEDATFHRMRMFPRQNYIAISKNQKNAFRGVRFIRTVYNATDTKHFAFQKNPGKYLIWFGRIMPGKGPHTAIQVALKAGLPLKIASSVPNRSQLPYYKKHIEPYLGKNGIEHVGFLRGEKLVRYIQGAKAMLFPVTHEEAFGLTIIESMSCGVPVIAYDHGACEEIIKQGKTGFVVHTQAQMVKALKKIDTISRQDCREHVLANFSEDAMVEGYLKAYHSVVKK